MSGTSMDGVDLAFCEFLYENKLWTFKIKKSETIPYDKNWIVRLSQLHKQPIHLYSKTDAFYGKFLGQLTKKFISEFNLEVDLIASHGHTIFHQPENGFTSQIGCGAGISGETNLPVVNDFRMMDIMQGGQGAPLVPIGDKYLFAEYDACLNLGGFANISIKEAKKAFDISPCNIIFNPLANEMSLPFDDEGKIAASGNVNNEMLNELNNLDYYQINAAKSLGIEWLNNHFLSVAKKYQSLSIEDKMATYSEHIATQISLVLNNNKIKNVLVTGGGTFNTFLINKIRSKTNTEIIIPSKEVINYKEALIFAFLGVLRIRNEINILDWSTGAKQSSIGGALHGDFSKIVGRLED
jgi:anhydro-N-acetylmuramic acid kinase